MVETNVLRKKIKDSGLKYSFLAKKMNISVNTFTLKLNSRSQFNDIQMKILRDELKMSNEDVDCILFADSFVKMVNQKDAT